MPTGVHAASRRELQRVIAAVEAVEKAFSYILLPK